MLSEGVEAVVVSTATPDDDPAVREAHERGVPVLHRGAALAALCAERTTVAVAGTHGKTTTSALLATILVGAGREPGWVVGAGIAHLGTSAAWGGPGPLVVEADESDGTFLSSAPTRPSSPTSSPTTSSTGAARTPCATGSAGSSPPRRGRSCSAPTTPARST